MIGLESSNSMAQKTNELETPRNISELIHDLKHLGNPLLGLPHSTNIFLYTLWLFNIAMENGPIIDGLPLKNDDFPWLC